MKRLLMILVLLLTASLVVGCSLPRCPAMPLPPTNPGAKAAHSFGADSKGRCYESEEFAKLMRYIVDLERGYSRP